MSGLPGSCLSRNMQTTPPWSLFSLDSFLLVSFLVSCGRDTADKPWVKRGLQ